MDISTISVPQVYKESDDFRLLLDWICEAFAKIQYDTENISDLYDPLRCKSDLLWYLCDTMGFKFDNRLCTAFNRLVLVYFMSMIRNRGSMDGVKLGASVNLAQFDVNKRGEENDINYDRLDNTNIPVNAVYVTPHVEDGYIDIVYFSDRIPVDACIEYVRPLGMYTLQNFGVRYDAKTKISIDARLTNIDDLGLSIGATHVGHYRREDYARLQKMNNEPQQKVNPNAKRNAVYYRNSVAEVEPNPNIDAGYRTLYSLQLCNSDHMIQSILGKPIFGLGYTPQKGEVDTVEDNYEIPNEQNASFNPNLRYDKTAETELAEEETYGKGVYTVDDIVIEVFDPVTGEPIKSKLVPRVNSIYKSIEDTLD